MLVCVAVHIEVTSTLTQEDEHRLAPAVLKLLSSILDMLPVAYMVRVETTDQFVVQHISPQVAPWDQGGPLPPTGEPTTFVSES